MTGLIEPPMSHHVAVARMLGFTRGHCSEGDTDPRKRSLLADSERRMINAEPHQHREP